MMREQSFLAVDWGTTNRRAYRISPDGAVEDTQRDDRGILAIEAGGFDAEAEALRARMGDLPILCAGMVGSNRGWAEAPYAPCPAGLDDLAALLHWIEPGRTAIIPGIEWRSEGRSDVMRGEEVQLLGAVLSGMAPADALLCQPGTHCKWAWMEGGRIARFATAMTGEMFALLKAHSLIGAQMADAVAPGAEFLRGVADAGDGALLTRLFGVRAAFVTGASGGQDAASYVSGLLIGSDVRSQVNDGTPVYILADPSLGALYSAAIRATGSEALILDSHAAFAAGITHIWRSIP
jgi:2-dehydro-3-deoxygalactonokinase